jgi:hypothetical protein
MAIGFFATASSGCSSDHRVSPWGGASMPPISAFAAPPDLEANLALIDKETDGSGLRKTAEIRADLPGGAGPVVARGYEGVDITGRTTYAVRAATTRGVIFAIGPFEGPERDEHATELVVALLPADTGRPEDGAFRSLTDLNGDGFLDAVLKSPRGVLEIHRIWAVGSSRYEVRMQAPPTEARDIDDDGRIDLLGRAPVAEGDPIAPVLLDVATFEGGRYLDTTAAARAFHARQAAPPDKAKAIAPPTDDAGRLRDAIERAWHALLAGRPRKGVLDELDKLMVPAALRASFDRHRARLAALPVVEESDAKH